MPFSAPALMVTRSPGACDTCLITSWPPMTRNGAVGVSSYASVDAQARAGTRGSPFSIPGAGPFWAPSAAVRVARPKQVRRTRAERRMKQSPQRTAGRTAKAERLLRLERREPCPCIRQVFALVEFLDQAVEIRKGFSFLIGLREG